MSSSADLQSQDLIIYSNNRITIDSDIPQLNLILHTQSNQPTWITTALIQSTLFDSCFINATSNSNNGYNLDHVKSPVLFVSFNKDFKTYEKQFSKYLNINSTNLKNFKFISFLSDEKIEDWFNVIKLNSSKFGGKPTIFIEKPELLLLLIENLSTDKLLSKFNELIKLSNNLFIISSIDKTFLKPLDLVNDISTILTEYISKILYKSNLVISLNSLETGHAIDITGSLTISKGNLPTPIQINEKKYLYLVNKESNVKLFYK